MAASDRFSRFSLASGKELQLGWNFQRRLVLTFHRISKNHNHSEFLLPLVLLQANLIFWNFSVFPSQIYLLKMTSYNLPADLRNLIGLLEHRRPKRHPIWRVLQLQFLDSFGWRNKLSRPPHTLRQEIFATWNFHGWDLKFAKLKCRQKYLFSSIMKF